MVAFEKFLFQKLVTNELICWENCVVQQDIFYLYQDDDQVDFQKNESWQHWYVRRRRENCNLYTIASKLELFNQNFSGSLLSTLSAINGCYAKRNWQSPIFPRCEHRIHWFAKKTNGTKCLWFFDDSCADLCNPKNFVDFATVARNRRLSTHYICTCSITIS